MEVYNKMSYLNEWTGKSLNFLTIGEEYLPSGTYFYVLDLFGDSSKIFKGYIELKR